MATKDKINKISGILLVGLVVIFGVGFFIDYVLQPFYLLYLAGLIFLVWFGTRKNGCGSCNQSCKLSPDINKNKDL